MIIDASAFLSILLKEPERETFMSLIGKDDNPMMSVASYLEAATKTHYTHNREIILIVDEMISALDITLAPVSVEQIMIAREAHKSFGKGMGHPAQLNLGDCFTYALAKITNLPLLFKGNDFIHTDLELIEY